MKKSLSLLACPLALASVAEAQGPNVAIVAAATGSSTDCRYVDVQNFLMATGRFSSVDIINANTSTPTLATLQNYDAILTWSNVGYQDPVALGDTFADYVDAGGGVVVSVFASTGSGALRLAGRWVPNYEVIVGGSGQTQGTVQTLGNVLLPAHPLIAGVTSFSGGTSSYRPVTTALTPGSVAVAEWNDGRILTAAGAQPNRADVVFYPPPSTCRADFWDINTDGDVLLANALVYVSGGGGGVGTPYCTPAVANSTGVPGDLQGSGSASIAMNNLSLDASDLPMNAFGYFLGSLTQGFTANPGGSQGNLCLGGGIGRFVGPGQIMNSGATGSFSLAVNLNALPTPGGLAPGMVGEMWSFQAWYRDQNPGVTSNFTNGLQVTLQ